ncbi:Hypothetical predicted protein [Octopus vulgaris]|uniref:Uncharacterized protein n=1 Tax=Octopus vulgaris TaxID=6645 RepID=A0AA36B281_OCTVU|nr:Hypothetical predicted protein [Octopus vulgaris]
MKRERQDKSVAEMIQLFEHNKAEGYNDGAVVAPEIITEEEKLDEIIHDIQQSEKETKGNENDDSNVDVDERVLEHQLK